MEKPSVTTVEKHEAQQRFLDMAFLQGILEAMPECQDSESYNRVLYTLTSVISTVIAEHAIDIEVSVRSLKNNLEEAIRTKRRDRIESSSP